MEEVLDVVDAKVLVFLKELEEKLGMIKEAAIINLDEIIKAAGKGKMQDDSAEGLVTYSDLKFPEKFDGNYPQMFPFVICCGITSGSFVTLNVHNGIPLEFKRVGENGMGAKRESPPEAGSPDSAHSGHDTQEMEIPPIDETHPEGGPQYKRPRTDHRNPKVIGASHFHTPWHALSLLMDIAHLLSVEDVGAWRDARSSVGDALEVLVEQRQP
jgi:hypothetical protein